MFGCINLTLRRAAIRTAPLTVCSLVALVLGGCSADSFLDPSTTGRWKQTPTIVPILERLSNLEDEPAEFVATSQVMPGDLVPEVDLYRLSAGDQLTIVIQDYITLGKPEEFERQVDLRGYVDIPRLPPVRAQGRTTAEFITAIEQAVRDRQINDRPIVSVNTRSQRKQTFSVLGAVQNPGTYFIPSPDYRLLEGLTSAGSFNETLPFIYVVRQVPLTDAASGRLPDAEPTKKPRAGRPPLESLPPTTTPDEPKKGENLLELIDSMVKDKPQPKSPGAFGADQPVAPTRPVDQPPIIDLPDPARPQAPVVTSGGGGWIYADGKWVKARAGAEDVGSQQNIVAQRVIKIPTGPLLAGAADVNIVLRPGDVIRAPIPRTGNVYISGQVGRPGVYSIPNDGKLTLRRAIAAASGLGNIAIPEKVDLTRMVGNDRQATVCLNFRAIEEGTQPDIYLKADDHINVGTNFWAQPLAVFRNGFRASYGFGFILDRNFQGEVFGVDNAVVR